MTKTSVGAMFIHLDCFSARAPRGTKQWTTHDIIHELTRTPEHSPHVEAPEAPVIVSGVHPQELEAEIADILKTGRDGGGRKIRKDSKIFIGSVASYPVPASELNTPETREMYFNWERDTAAFYHSAFGTKNVRTIIKHLDEGYIHLHAVVMPHLAEDGRFDFNLLHPGHRAREVYRAACNVRGEPPTRRGIDAAVSAAMGEFQDSYFEMVGRQNGLARFGSRGKPLSYKQWKRLNKKRPKASKAIVEALQHNPLLAPDYCALKDKVQTQEVVAAAFVEISATAGVSPADPAAVPAAVAEIARAANSVPEFAARAAVREAELKALQKLHEQVLAERDRLQKALREMRDAWDRTIEIMLKGFRLSKSAVLQRAADLLRKWVSGHGVSSDTLEGLDRIISAPAGPLQSGRHEARTPESSR